MNDDNAKLFGKLFDQGLIVEVNSIDYSKWVPSATKDGIWENYFVSDSGELFHLMNGWMLNVDTRDIASPESTENFNLDYSDEPYVNYVVVLENLTSPEVQKTIEQKKLRDRLNKKGLILEIPPESWSPIATKDKKWKNYFESESGVLLHLTNGWLINDETGELKQTAGY